MPMPERRITPPPDCQLDHAELRLFQQIVDSLPGSHFVQADAHMLVSFVQGVTLSRLAYNAALDDPAELKTWEAVTRTLASLAGKLRLAPSARQHPRTAGRAIDRQHDPRAWQPKA